MQISTSASMDPNKWCVCDCSRYILYFTAITKLWIISHFADFEQVIIKISHFADFEQVIIKISYFADFEQVIINKTPLGETGYLGIFFFLRPLPCVTRTPPQLLRPVRASTGSELYPDTGFFECLSIQFFNSPAPMLLTGCHATPVFTRCSPPPT